MSSKAMSLKARIRNLAKQKNISAQAVLQNFMFECFLDRLSQSEYKGKFILKGGILIAAIVGLDNRSTMDLDATLRQLKLTEENIIAAMDTICAIPTDDEVLFRIGAIRPIRADDIYGGYRVALTATFDTIETPLTIDISAGDVITPKAVKFLIHGILDEKKRIELWAYNVETIMAEKLETILSRNILNTRPRDFYDIHILFTTQPFDSELFGRAFAATASHRGTTEQISDTEKWIHIISISKELQDMWRKYQQKFSYASEIDWERIIHSIKSLCNLISSQG